MAVQQKTTAKLIPRPEGPSRGVSTTRSETGRPSGGADVCLHNSKLFHRMGEINHDNPGPWEKQITASSNKSHAVQGSVRSTRAWNDSLEARNIATQGVYRTTVIRYSGLRRIATMPISRYRGRNDTFFHVFFAW